MDACGAHCYGLILGLLCLSIAGAWAQDAPGPTVNPLTRPITKLKDLCLETVLAEQGAPKAVLAIDPSKRYLALAEYIQEKVKECAGAVLPILADASPGEALKGAHVIALGNMATNPFIETLYRRYYTYLDLYYPGKGGYDLRTLHNPYGTGKNVILVGGSDDDGVARAADKLLQKLTPGTPLKIGWTMEVKLGDGLTPPPPGGSVAVWGGRGGDEGYGFGWNPISVAFGLYYMTGDPAYVDDFRSLVSTKGAPNPRLENGDRMFMDLKHPLATVYHYRGHIAPLIWDLVEESPVFTDEERLYVANELLGQQNYLHLDTCRSFAQNGILPDRHAIYEILNVWTGSRYFSRSYPDPVWEERLDLAARAFATSLATLASNTPRIETGSVILPILQFALYSGADDYFRPGGVFAQRMDKLLFLGDEVGGGEWSYTLLQATAHALKDGRFLSVHPIPEKDALRFRLDQSYLSGVPPVKATDVTGLRSFPMAEPNHKRLRMSVPLQEAFEFLIYRSAVDEQKQHLFLYGYYEGSKSPPRVNAILNYQNHGVRLLNVGQQNAVYVRKDGMLEGGPATGAALKRIEEIGELAYACAEVPDHDFSRWVRSLFILKGRCVAVFDRVIARETGVYEVSSRWYPSNRPASEPDGLRWTVGKRQCALVSAENAQIERPGAAMDFVYRGPIEKNASRLFRTLLADAPKDAPKPAIAPFGESAAILQAAGLALVGQGSLSKDGFAADAEAFLIRPDAWAMVNGTTLTAQGIEIRSDQPVTLSWNPADGGLLVKAQGKAAKVVVCGHEVSCPAGKETRAEAAPPDAKAASAQLAAALEGVLKSAQAGRQVAAPPASKEQPAKLGQLWRTKLDGGITAMLACDSGVLVGSKKGAVCLLQPNGSPRWQFATGGPVYALASAKRQGKPILLAGSDDEHVYAFAEEGDLLWKYKAKVSEWMLFHFNYWTMDKKAKVRKILPTDVEEDGKLDIFIGTGGSAVERLDEDGKPLWLFTFLYGTPMSLALADVRPDHPGKELIAGTFDVSYDSVVRFIDPAKGEEIAGGFTNRYPPPEKGPGKPEPSSFSQGNVFMWLHDLPDGKCGLMRVLCGGNWNQLAMNDPATGKCLWGKDFGPGGGGYGSQFVAGAATPDLNGDGRPDVVVGLQNGWVCAFDGPSGALLWSAFMGSPVRMVAGGGSGRLVACVLIGCENGDVVQLDKAGHRTHQARLSGSVQSGVALAGEPPTWVVGTSSGQVAALAPDAPDAKLPDLPTPFPYRLSASPDGGKSSLALTTVTVGEGVFVGAAFGRSKAWALAPLPEQEMDVRVLCPAQAKVAKDKGCLTIESGADDSLLVRMDLDPVTGPYRRGIVIERDRWGNMRTNGPVAKVIMEGRMGFFMAQAVGDWVDFDLPVPADGRYEVSACFCKYFDRPIVNVLLDGAPLREDLDLFSEKVEWTPPVALGKRMLSKGNHVLRFVVKGKAAASTGCYVGVESVGLIAEDGDEMQDLRVSSKGAALCGEWRSGPFRYVTAFRRPDASSAVSIGDVRLDGDACSVVLRDGEATYWALRNGVRLEASGKVLAELDNRRDACGGR